MNIRLAGIICTMEQYSTEQLVDLLTGQLSLHRVWLSKGSQKEQELLLSASQQIVQHSPSGFNWGYLGSGPFQLALAVCVELFGTRKAKLVYREFMTRFIATLPANEDFEVELDLTDFVVKHLDLLLDG